MKQMRDQISNLREEVLSIRDLKAEMQRSLARLVEEGQTSQSDITKLEDRISNHRVSAKRQFRDMNTKISDCQQNTEKAVSIAGLQPELMKVEAESVLNAVLGKIREGNEDRDSNLQLLRQDIQSLEGRVKGMEGRNAQARELESDAEKAQTPRTPSSTKLRRRVPRVPEGRRHACWQGCLRCQGLQGLSGTLSGTLSAKASPKRMATSFNADSLAASFDFAAGAVDKDNDKNKNIQDLVEEMEATCSASNTDHETVDQGHFGPI